MNILKPTSGSNSRSELYNRESGQKRVSTLLREKRRVSSALEKVCKEAQGKGEEEEEGAKEKMAESFLGKTRQTHKIPLCPGSSRNTTNRHIVGKTLKVKVEKIFKVAREKRGAILQTIRQVKATARATGRPHSTGGTGTRLLALSTPRLPRQLF